MSQTLLEQDAYEIIQSRLRAHGKDLAGRLDRLNGERKKAFGGQEAQLLATGRVGTAHNCIPVDMVAVGERFLFGYNVFLGLKGETSLSDVFAVYKYQERNFQSESLALIEDKQFIEDYKNLYKYYKNARFARFAVIRQQLFMVFRVGKSANDVKTFKWAFEGDALRYLGNRSDHELSYPGQHEFSWKRPARESFRSGKYPHISIEDKLFVETTGGDLTIKVEDNTETGEGIYTESVEHRDQTLDDAEVHYAFVDNLCLLKIRPYKENNYRYILFNGKTRQALRIDALEEACLLLPDHQGVIFPTGYYLQNGTYKLFEGSGEKLKFDKRILSPNGEDFLTVFFAPESGSYLLISYNLIRQAAEPPMLCHGYTLFENGELLLFRAAQEPQRSHTIQIWQTPYTHPDRNDPETEDSYLVKIGNGELVRAIAGCRELYTLTHKEDSYLNLYADIHSKSSELLDAYHWLDRQETEKLAEPLRLIREAAAAAIGEYEKVSSIRKATEAEVGRFADKAKKLLGESRRNRPEAVDGFVAILAGLRSLHGEVITLKELRYADTALLEQLETEITQAAADASLACVTFLSSEKALSPYGNRLAEINTRIPLIGKGTEGREIEGQIAALAKELELLTETLGSLKIEDPTQTARIVEDISGLFAQTNSLRARLASRRKEIDAAEAAAEFSAQLKLLEQSAAGFLDVSGTPALCDQYLTRLALQLEELEARFAQQDDFLLILGQKREEISNAFESKKLQLREAHNQRIAKLEESAERILKGIHQKALSLPTQAELNGYFAGDLMVEKIRSQAKELHTLGESIKGEALESKLRALREETARQLRDKSELFGGGEEGTLKLGSHRFRVNTQALDVTTVLREREMYFHLTGTNFYDKIEDTEFSAMRPFWERALPSESGEVYRGEYLAWTFWQSAGEKAESLTLKELQSAIYGFMQARYGDGYVKGVHDHDAALLLHALIQIHPKADLLRFAPVARACALYWQAYVLGEEERTLLQRQLEGAGSIRAIFPGADAFAGLIGEMTESIRAFCREQGLFQEEAAEEAAAYLFEERTLHTDDLLSGEAAALCAGFRAHLQKAKGEAHFAQRLEALEKYPAERYNLLREWLRAYAAHAQLPADGIIEEAAFCLLKNEQGFRKAPVPAVTRISGMLGEHGLIQRGVYALSYTGFMGKMRRFTEADVPAYESYAKKRKCLVDAFRAELNLASFESKVLSSFVRNKLIDTVYLPLVGHNLAKQMGTAGDARRTDLMGMLLLLSPPGYGKTTLLEYLANRLGLVYIKINGPALGPDVRSLDPAEASSAAARQQLERLNLAFEMGDNVLLLIDDIQHCHPEFLQKFISLCDAQRKIEGVYKSRSRTYDLRGRKVVIAMAGNPYTESGDKFRIPDMLANRADIYNLGDVIGGAADVFALSFLENCLTSHPSLRSLSGQRIKDVYSFIALAESGGSAEVSFEGAYSAEEVQEYAALFAKLIRLRDTVLRVNSAYIASASQSDSHRTEPPFLLQGSYRNMNKLAEKVHPLINDGELLTLLLSHYEGEAQTLTSGAEANMLKLKELMGILSESDAARWQDIKSRYAEETRIRALSGEGAAGLIATGISTLAEGVAGIRDALEGRE